MANILIVYASDWGSTKKMADAVAKGVNSVAGSKAVVQVADEVIAEDVIAADGVIVGAPVHMGSPDARIKTFIDKVCSGLWMKRERSCWARKPHFRGPFYDLGVNFLNKKGSFS